MSDNPCAANVDARSETVLPRNAVEWLMLFGPGAVIASLTIGTGELIFSSRGGAIFGYRILFLFVAISLLKWSLVVAASRHIVLTGVHPYRRMVELPGPRGWLLIVLLMVAALCLPIWLSFHCSVLGNLISWVTGTEAAWGGAADFAWGAIAFVVVVIITGTRGYSTVERVQLMIIGAMMVCTAAALLLCRPDWLALLHGALVPQPLSYPSWLADSYPEIANQPVWVETTRYVGVVGGAGFDYMAYVTFVRERRWGWAARAPASPADLATLAHDRHHPVRQWLRAPLVDSSMSFLVVVVFSAVFVVMGVLVLAPHQKIPDESNFLGLQSEFVTRLHPWLLPLYVAGALLAMFGTLYGTLEVACSITSEMAFCRGRSFAQRHRRRIRWLTVLWCAAGTSLVLGGLFLYRTTGGVGKPRLILAILTPANLFTGVFGCGLFCLLNLWMDHRFLPKGLRMPPWLWILNGISALLFLALGVKGYIDDPSRGYALAAAGAAIVGGVVISWTIGRRWFEG